jgi:hypothetical protein
MYMCHEKTGHRKPTVPVCAVPLSRLEALLRPPIRTYDQQADDQRRCCLSRKTIRGRQLHQPTAGSLSSPLEPRDGPGIGKTSSVSSSLIPLWL